MADVDRGGEAGAQHGRGDRAEAVDQQRTLHRVGIARGFGALQVLERAQQIEQSHRDRDPQPGQQLLATRPELPKLGHGQVQAHLAHIALPGGGVDLDQACGPGQGDPHQHRQQPPRQGQPYGAEVGHQDHRQHRQAHHRLGIGAQQEPQADVAQGDARQGGQQGGPGQPAP